MPLCHGVVKGGWILIRSGDNHALYCEQIVRIGRISIVPWAAPGQRAAQAIAASRSGASIR